LEVYWLSSFFHAMEMQNDAWRQIADQTKAVIFLATPHRGSNLAAILGNVVSALGAIGALTRMTVSVKELEAKAPALQDLNVWYINNAGRVGIATHCFYEKQTVRGGLVVDEASGRLELPGADPIAIDADHFNICKPPSHEALIYRRIRQIVYETIATPDLPTPSSATWQVLKPMGGQRAPHLPGQPAAFFPTDVVLGLIISWLIFSATACSRPDTRFSLTRACGSGPIGLSRSRSESIGATT
jgi:hypothetical protein